MRNCLKIIPLIILISILLSSCQAAEPAASEKTFPQFTFTHYTTAGVTEDFEAIILFEESVSTFTSYQVAFVSCNCRDSLVNYYSVAYVELLNNKDSADEAAIRSITFGDNKGLWGDSNPNHNMPDYTQEYMDHNFVQLLVRQTKADIDAWQGYAHQLPIIDVDAVSGATVSTSNILSMLQGLFAYHAENYYGD